MPLYDGSDVPPDGLEPGRAIATNGGNRLSLDAILSLLASSQRRAILEHLRESSESVASVEDVVTHVVQREAERTGQLPSHDQVEVALFNVHLPKLSDAEVIEYDERSRQVRYWPDERLEHWLALVEDQEPD